MFRVAIAAAACALVAGCGFEPLYARKTGSAPSPLAKIRIEPIADRIGQQLHNLLLDRLNPKGRPVAARYILSINLSESLQQLGVRKDEVATRANLVMRASFRLARANDDTTLLKANAMSANSYNILRSEFATLSAENDARARAVRELSDEIMTRIGFYLSRNK